jgi:hypothetical protein
MTACEFIKDNTITDRKALKDALGLPESVPDSFAIKPIKPIGVGRFIGDKLPGEWSCNKQLECGAVYPIYHSEGQRFVIGKNGKGLKFTPKSWRELVWFSYK